MSILPENTGNIPVYRFYINTFSSVTYEVFPLNFLNTSLVDELEKEQVFYRRKFSGTLLFGTNDKVFNVSGEECNRIDDFALLWAIENSDSCAVIYLTITRTVEGVADTYWEGYFSTTDGTFDIDKCTFEVTPLVLDDYNEILENAEKEYNLFLGVDNDIETEAIRGAIHYTYSRNMWLMDVIEYLAGDATAGIAPGCSVSSDFFSEATNPATGLDNELLLLTIAAKSDIMFPAASDPATSAMLSWNGLMDILWGMFQVRWNYDADTDTINVEHISWFSALGSLDIRNQRLTASTNKYSYVKEKMPKYEYFQWVEADDRNFLGTYIYYPTGCIDGNYENNKKQTKVNVTTDLEFIQTQMDIAPEAINPEGFVILCNYEDGGTYYVVVSAGEYYPASGAKMNMPMSWGNLHHNYYRHNRSAIEGYLNGSLVTFYSAVKTKKQECSIILCDTFDPNNEIVTELGTEYFGGINGVVGNAKISPTGLIDLQVLYGVPDNPIIPTVTKIINFIQRGTTIDWYLTSPSDADYTWHPYEEIWDDTGDPAGSECELVCSEGEAADPESFTVLTGTINGSFTFADTCAAYQAGYTLWIQAEDTSGMTMVDNGWTVIFTRDCDYINTECKPCGS